MQSVSLKPQLLAGIRRNFRSGRNQAGVVSLINACVNDAGLYPYEPLNNPIDVSAAAGVPALEVFRGPNYIVAFGNDDKVYTLADDDDDWVETAITSTLKNPDDPDTTLTIDCGTNMWHFAAFQRGWIATNGLCALYSVAGEGVYLDTLTHPLCVCSFRGRIFWGGMARHWLRFNAKGLSADMWGQSLSAMTDSWIGWCTIQGRDILQHVFPERAVSAGTGRTEDEMTTNGGFAGGSTGWTAGAGWTYTATPNRMVAAAASSNLDYRVTTAMADGADTYRLEADISRTSGSLTVSIAYVALGVVVNYIGDLTLDSTGLHVVYFQSDSPGFAFDIRLTGVAFTGTVHGVSLKRSAHFDKFTSWEEQARLLQSGFSPASDQGKILCIKALHDHVVVYGENFIAAYSPVSVPSPTFGKVSIASFGVAGRRAVGGDLNKHLLCDTSGKLWQLDNQLRFEPVGYEELFRLAVAYGGLSTIAIGYDDNSDTAYISLVDAVYTAGTTYVLTAVGMSQVRTELVHSVVGTRGSATWADTAGYATDGDSDVFYLLTDALDFDAVGPKTVKRLQVFGEGVETLAVIVQFRYAGDTTWRSGSAQVCNAMGEVYPEQSGLEFRFAFLAANFAVVRLYDIIVTFETEIRMNAKSVIARR